MRKEKILPKSADQFSSPICFLHNAYHSILLSSAHADNECWHASSWIRVKRIRLFHSVDSTTPTYYSNSSFCSGRSVMTMRWINRQTGQEINNANAVWWLPTTSRAQLGPHTKGSLFFLSLSIMLTNTSSLDQCEIFTLPDDYVSPRFTWTLLLPRVNRSTGKCQQNSLDYYQTRTLHSSLSLSFFKSTPMCSLYLDDAMEFTDRRRVSPVSSSSSAKHRVPREEYLTDNQRKYALEKCKRHFVCSEVDE